VFRYRRRPGEQDRNGNTDQHQRNQETRRWKHFQEAITAFNEVLKIDPEDLKAHYNLMLCYQGIGNEEMVAKEQALYRRFKADESAQSITGPYRQLHPDDNNERQQIHEHRSVPLRYEPPLTSYQRNGRSQPPRVTALLK
jgi:tetratricopeptide (TPR) repeat protein